MKKRHFLYLAGFAAQIVLLRRKKPLVGTIVLTDRCNLDCKHCAVHNLECRMYSYPTIRGEMESLYRDGVRILFFCGGETFLWESDNKRIHDLVREAKEIGFYIVNVVTNGTLEMDIQGVDVMFLSLDGQRETHNRIRGDVFDLVMSRVAATQGQNFCVFMAINNENYMEIESVCRFVREHPKLRSISFNLHMPYPGTEHLSLSPEQRVESVNTIRAMIDQGYPVFNLKSSLDVYLKNKWKRPCRQCVVSENGKRFQCGRCIEIDGLCEQCGYLFAAEFSRLFSGHPSAIADVVKTYLRFI
ncbi:MAG: radical SAM protein [Planctomycetaceae bacterium]|nr:radical SAM protein [Planctomycetaceae bacterium]